MLKLLHKGFAFQDADHESHPGGRGKVRLVHFSRSKRCLFPRAYLPRPQILSPLCLPGAGLPVQGPPIWPFPLTKGVYQGDWSSFAPSPAVGYKDPPILGRLADFCPVPQPSSTGHGIGSLPHPVHGAQGELDEKHLEPGQQAVFVGLRLDSTAMSVSLTSQSGEHRGPPVPFSPWQTAGVGPVPEAVGHDLSCSGCCSSGPPQNSATAG